VTFEDGFFDVVLLLSVLEHVHDPVLVLKESRRVLRENGALLINVPTWFGKIFLEMSAFLLHLSPVSSIDDHKMYYDKRDLWPLLVRAGFRPSSLRMRYHKFGMNLFCICQKNPK
jgi:SAM-dependent methyltransferase